LNSQEKQKEQFNQVSQVSSLEQSFMNVEQKLDSLVESVSSFKANSTTVEIGIPTSVGFRK
jgi:flagellar hook assembly protein FlgD